MLKPYNFLKEVFYLSLFLTGLIGQDVTVSLSDIQADGYTSDIIVPLSINSPNHSIGGIQFDLSVSPDLIQLFATTPTEDAPGFSSDFTNLSEGLSRVVFYNSSSSDGIQPGTNISVLNLHFNGLEVLSAVLDLLIFV